MKLIIDISEEKYIAIKNNLGTFPREYKEWGLQAIAEGIPLDDIKAEIPILSHWQTDDGQDLLMVADVLECIDNHTGKEQSE